jgi:hypothetical protein
MTNRWLTLLETHLEKGLLGLAGIFLLAMAYMYVIKSPNTVDYGGKKLGPRELLVEIKGDADDLDRRVGSARAEPYEGKDFSEQLRRLHAKSIFESASQEGPRLEPELRLAATFGEPIVVPGLKENEEAVGSVALVTPLKPSQPKLRTGRSLAAREELRISATEEPSSAPPPEEASEPDEVAWVTVAAYFDKKAQYNEMIKAGYAPYRAKAYVVGLDVQRQEVLSSGEYSDWQDVKGAKAMPKFDVPEPVFDDQTNELMNKDEIRRAFATVKATQPTLMQPPFYVVEGGDFWEMPALAGHEEVDEELEEEEPDRAVITATGGRGAPLTRVVRPPTMRSPGPSRGAPPGAGRMGGGAVAGPGAGGYQGAGARSEADQRREARREIRQDLKDSRKLLGKKEYAEARGLAERIIGNQYASRGDVRKARDIVKAAERWLRLEQERADAMRTGRTVAGRLRPSRSGDVAELITHPETGEPAVWFHDDTVEAGKTYRYRMRVKLWNRYVGHKRPLQDPAQAKQPLVVGEWSFPSEPITVTPSTYFFFSGAHAPDTASADVWKWRKGRWFKERFDVTVGDVIGGRVRNVRTGEYDKEGDEVKADIDFTTGAVVLDLRFDEPVEDRWRGKDGVFSYREKTSPVMVYLDPADGQVKQRVLAFDRRDPKRKELEDQAW